MNSTIHVKAVKSTSPNRAYAGRSSYLAAPLWSRDVFYEKGDLVIYNGMHFECLASHVSSATMNPQYTKDYWSGDLPL